MIYTFTKYTKFRPLLYAFLLVPLLVSWNISYSQGLAANKYIYTVGSGGDFASLTNIDGVFHKLNVQGSVPTGGYTFQITGNLLESGTHTLKQLTGMSAANKIRIVPSNNTTLRTINGTINGGMIRLEGADYVEFEGGTGTTRLIRFRNDGYNTFVFTGDATNNRISNCFVESKNPATNNPPNINYGIVFFGSGTTGNSFNTIENCELSGGYGANLLEKPLSVINSYTSGTAINSNNKILNNFMYDFGGYGNGEVNAIYINTGSNSWTISNNSFYFKTNVSAAAAGNHSFNFINLQAGSDHTVDGNNIGGTSITGGQGTMQILEGASGFFKVRGIVVNLKDISKTATIKNNTISNIAHSYNSTTGDQEAFTSIDIISGNATVTDNTIKNITVNCSETLTRLVTGIKASGTGALISNITSNTINDLSSQAGLYGIRNAGKGTVVINKNEIHTLTSSSASTNSTTPAASGIYITDGSDITIEQNVIGTIECTNFNAANSTGIALSGATKATVTRNRIYDIRNNDKNAVGILTGTGSWALTNNMISLGNFANGVSNNALITYIGIYNITTGTLLELYYNTVLIDGRNNGNKEYTSYCFYRGIGARTPVIIYNNLFQNNRDFNESTGGGDGSNIKGDHYAIAIEETDNWSTNITLCGNSVPRVNYNRYFSANTKKMGRWGIAPNNNAPNDTFANWQTKSGGDPNSARLTTAIITFEKPEHAILKLTGAATLYSEVIGMGTPIPGVVIDYYSTFRRLPSTIGAHELYEIITSIASGSWTDPTRWWPSRVPMYFDEVVINTGHSITVPSTYTAQFYRLTVNSGGALTLTNNTSTLEGSVLHAPSLGVTGEFSNSGTFNANNGLVKLAGRLTNNGTFNAGSGLVQLNIDIISGLTGCSFNYFYDLNTKTNISDINGSKSTTFHDLTLLNNAFTSILSDTDPALSPAKTITINNILDIQGAGVFSIGGNANTNTLAIGSSAVNGIVTGSGKLSGSIYSNLHILGTTGNVSASPVTFTSGFNKLNDLWIERQNAVDAIILGAGGVTVSGRLTLIKGHINTLTNLLTMDVNAIVTDGILGGSNNSYVNGPMAKNTNSTTHFSFPVGNVDILGRIGITPTSTNPTTFTAKYYKQDPTVTPLGRAIQYSEPVMDPVNDLHHVSEREYWTLDRTSSGAPANGRVRLNWTSYSLVSKNPYYWPGLRIARHEKNTNLWENKGPATVKTLSPNANPSSSGYYGGSSSYGFVESDEVTNFSPFTLATTLELMYNPLPVKLLDLKAVPQNKQINVEWITTNEYNSDYFIVEKSIDGVNFTSIGKVAAAGNSGTLRTYTLADKQPYYGVNYYRLQQADKDGVISPSRIVSAELTSSSADSRFDIYPNPSDGKLLTIQVAYKGEIAVNIYSILGIEVEAQKIIADGKIATLQPRTNLAPGIYVIKVLTAKGSYQQKIIIK